MPGVGKDARIAASSSRVSICLHAVPLRPALAGLSQRCTREVDHVAAVPNGEAGCPRCYRSTRTAHARHRHRPGFSGSCKAGDHGTPQVVRMTPHHPPRGDTATLPRPPPQPLSLNKVIIPCRQLEKHFSCVGHGAHRGSICRLPSDVAIAEVQCCYMALLSSSLCTNGKLHLVDRGPQEVTSAK